MFSIHRFRCILIRQSRVDRQFLLLLLRSYDFYVLRTENKRRTAFDKEQKTCIIITFGLHFDLGTFHLLHKVKRKFTFIGLSMYSVLFGSLSFSLFGRLQNRRPTRNKREFRPFSSKFTCTHVVCLSVTFKESQ